MKNQVFDKSGDLGIENAESTGESVFSIPLHVQLFRA
jgi:hypothetical protein